MSYLLIWFLIGFIPVTLLFIAAVYGGLSPERDDWLAWIILSFLGPFTFVIIVIVCIDLLRKRKIL